jgi:hypothetical protein
MINGYLIIVYYVEILIIIKIMLQFETLNIIIKIK